MSPEVIVTDELFRESEADAVCDIVRSGVKVFASLHGDGAAGVLGSAVFGKLAYVMELFVVLSPLPRVGTVKEVVDVREALGRAV